MSKSTQAQQSKRRAAKAGLRYVNDFDEGYRRRKCGRGFTYLSLRGQTLTSKKERGRINELAIPPAWEEVWICPDARGHIQARGRDEDGRWQYIYHDRWETISAATKFDRMQRFGDVLPRIRRRVRRDLNRKKLDRRRVLAAVTRLLDKARLRVGSEGSVDAKGATTLDGDHVEIEGFQVALEFPSKSGQRRELQFRDSKVAKVVRGCEELDGQHLFTYLEGDEENQITSSDVNRYLNEVADEKVTAKDFRTWWGSVVALSELTGMSEEDRQKEREAACRQAIQSAAESLGNTAAVCRKSYVHPGMIAAARSGELVNLLQKIKEEKIDELAVDEVKFKQLLPLLEFS